MSRSSPGSGSRPARRLRLERRSRPTSTATLIVKSVLVALLVVGALIHDYVLGPRLQRELRERRCTGHRDTPAARRRRLAQLHADDRRADSRRRRATVTLTKHGGTHGSPMGPLLRRAAWQSRCLDSRRAKPGSVRGGPAWRRPSRNLAIRTDSCSGFMDDAVRHLALLTQDDGGRQLVARPAGGDGGDRARDCRGARDRRLLTSTSTTSAPTSSCCARRTARASRTRRRCRGCAAARASRVRPQPRARRS